MIGEYEKKLNKEICILCNLKYVDFMLPENFVKLMELTLDSEALFTLGKIVNTAMINQNRKEFLLTLKRFIAHEVQYSGGMFNWDKLDTDKVKKAICQTEWK